MAPKKYLTRTREFFLFTFEIISAGHFNEFNIILNQSSMELGAAVPMPLVTPSLVLCEG